MAPSTPRAWWKRRWRTTARCFRSLVLEECAPRLAAQVARFHHLDEQRRRAVLRILEPFEQHLHHGQLDVQADEVAQRERPDRMVRAELHRLVDLLRAREPLAEREGPLGGPRARAG